jgi:hypothetical protein
MAPEKSEGKEVEYVRKWGVLRLYIIRHLLGVGSAWLLGVRFSISFKQSSKTLAKFRVGATRQNMGEKMTDRR